ncbi:hypothetical protein K3169_15145 [Pseudomonas phytophila]|uniref:Uncharacterized protein n=1 Tax=Pseudomonas phytophila TaxID=2867264 RepID=A0ABY6F777_9PSED|nr:MULTISPECIES: hypothetical protein [Pseudomonas]MCD5974272.1 hypothetical protein [Pseudomonas quasicaspiana]UXZ93731.1 hypothetical protein K3169_15145 [Pseudomonas phytophila]
MATASVWRTTPRKASAGFMVSLVLLVLPAGVHASGQLPPSTLEDRTLPSAAACRAFLEATWRTDQQKADPQPLPGDNGSRQTLIYSDGVVAIDDKHLTYDVEEGWQFRRLLRDINMSSIRTSYSYERRSYRCDDAHLTGTSIKGYALEGYEALPEN